MKLRNLREIRKRCDLTQKELGDRIGVSESTISMYESGNREPDIETMLKISDYFGVSVDYLLGGKMAHGYDPELEELLEELKNRPEMRMLFNLANNASKEDVLRAVKIIEALKEG